MEIHCVSGWDQGPGNWAYATFYNVFYLSAIESALGTDFGWKKQPGFADAPAPQKPNTGVTNLLVNCTGIEHRIVVLLSAVNDSAAPAVEYLAKWPTK